MRTLLPIVLLAVVSCSKTPEGPLTIEAAEEYARARGVVLTEKKEYEGSGSRAFQYQTGTVRVVIYQFNTPVAAREWKTMVDDMPIGQQPRVVAGAVAFSLSGKPDSEVQKVVTALSAP